MAIAAFSASRRGLLAAVLGSLAVMVGACGAQAQEWPSRPVTMVVPFGPGASNDVLTRRLSDVLSTQLGQPFVVENRPGAGGFTATLAVSQGEGDGYTFVEMPSSIVGFGPIMGVQMDPLEDVTPVALFARSPGGMVVPASLPVNNVREFIDYAKANIETTFVGYTGIGATQHQMAELFKKSAGLENLKSVNYQSSAEAQTDLVAGRLHLMFATVAAVRGQIESGQLKLLAYTNDSYAPGSPPAPTMAEEGVEGMEGAQVWWGIFGPGSLPEDITNKMNEAINTAVDDPGFIELMASSGAVPVKLSPQEFADAIREEGVRVQEFVEFTGIKPQQ